MARLYDEAPERKSQPSAVAQHIGRLYSGLRGLTGQIRNTIERVNI